ncbi:transcriptional regulator, partial [Streptomyces sp. NPDC005534]
WAARQSGDPVMPAVADWMRVWDMWTTADWDDAIALSDRAIRSVQQEYDRGEPLAVRAWGTLQLRAAVSAARGGRKAEAKDRIKHARTAAKRIAADAGAPVYDRHSLTFSPGNVQIHAISVALEMHEQREALSIDRRTSVDVIDALPNSRQGHHYMDLARAWLWDGNRDKALKQLERAESIAPQLVRNHPIARSTLRSIVYAERASTRETLRRMSDRFHLDG